MPAQCEQIQPKPSHDIIALHRPTNNMLSCPDALVIFMCLALPVLFIVTGLAHELANLIIFFSFWVVAMAMLNVTDRLETKHEKPTQTQPNASKSSLTPPY